MEGVSCRDGHCECTCAVCGSGRCVCARASPQHVWINMFRIAPAVYRRDIYRGRAGLSERRETLSHPPHYRRTRPSYLEYTKTDDSVYSVVSVETERTPEKSVSLDRYIERVSPCFEEK